MVKWFLDDKAPYHGLRALSPAVNASPRDRVFYPEDQTHLTFERSATVSEFLPVLVIAKSQASASDGIEEKRMILGSTVRYDLDYREGLIPNAKTFQNKDASIRLRPTTIEARTERGLRWSVARHA